MHPKTHTSSDRPTVGVIRRPGTTAVKVVLPDDGLTTRAALDAAMSALVMEAARQAQSEAAAVSELEQREVA